MITDIRKHFTSSAYKIILWVTILALAGVFSIPTMFQTLRNGGAWALQVNGYSIGQEEFVREAASKREWLAHFRSQYGPYADYLLQAIGLSSDPQSLALHILIKEALMYQAARASNFYLNNEYIEAQMNNQQFIIQELGSIVPPYVFDQSGNVNQAALKEVLRRNKIKISAFEEKAERLLLNKMASDMITASYYTPLFELKSKYAQDRLKKRYSILTFDFDALLKKELSKEIGDADLTLYFETQNKKKRRYYIPEKRGGLVWRFDAETYGITISNEEIEAYYDNNKTKEFVEEPAKVQVRRILLTLNEGQTPQALAQLAQDLHADLLENPNSFDQKAREYSQDKESAKNGGLLEAFSRGTYGKAFERAAFSLKKDGDISSIVTTDNGYEILQRINKKMQRIKPLATVKNEIKKTLAFNAFRSEFADAMRCALEQTCSDSNALQAFIKEKGAKAEVFQPAAQDDSSVTKALFNLAQDEVTFFVEGSEGIVVQLTTIEDGHYPSIEAVKSIVIQDLHHERAQQELATALENASKQAKTRTFKELEKDFSAQYALTPWLTGNDKEAIDALKEKGIPVDQMLQIEKEEMTVSTISNFDGYLIRLDQIQEFDQDDFDAQKDALAAKIKKESLSLYVESAVDYLYRNAKIETNSLLFGRESEEELQYER